mgnify:CR=1 FL=1
MRIVKIVIVLEKRNVDRSSRYRQLRWTTHYSVAGRSLGRLYPPALVADLACWAASAAERRTLTVARCAGVARGHKSTHWTRCFEKFSS